jgi:PAS domain S-box-containing protein
MIAAEHWRARAGTAGRPGLVRTLGQKLVPGIAGMVALTLVVVTTVLLQLATEQDRSAVEHSRQLVIAALEARKAEIPRSVQDYAYWGDAYRNLHLNLNTAWAYDQGNVGASLRDALGLDFAFVIGPDGQTSYAVIDGKLVGEDAHRRLRGGLDRLVSQVRAGIGDAPEPSIELLEADGAPAIVGAAMLTPGGDATVQPAPGPPSVLIFADVLGPAKLAALGTLHFVEGLRVVRPGEVSATQLPLATLDGTPLPGLTWRQPTPGRDLLRKVLPWLVFSIVAMGPLSWLVLRRAASEASHRALEESEARFRGTFENAAVGIAHVGLDGVWLRVNRRLGEIVGYTQEELLAQGLEKVAQLEGMAPSPGRAERLLSGEIPFDHVERCGTHKDGHLVWISQTTSVQHDAGGRPLYLIVVIEDITERKQAETVKGRFLAMISHEIRTPLNGILSVNDLLRDTALDPSQQEYLRLQHEAGQTLLVVINDILDFSKLEADKIAITPEPVDVRELVRSCVAPFAGTAAGKGLGLETELDPALPSLILLDQARMRQVMGNLLSNAIKFTAQGEVRLRARCGTAADGKRRIEVEVEDTGIGIPPDKLGELFTPFTQADSSIARRFGGTGLGLAIAKMLVERQGGTIGVTSVPERGSTFWFSLPLLEAEVQARDAVTIDVGRQGAARILLVEDTLTNRRLVSAMLQGAGHEVEAVEDGRAAVERAAAGGFDLILMDVQMPVMDGLEATSRIRALPPPAGQVPILAFTANALMEGRARCLEAGMDGIVLKPIKRAALLEAVQAHVAAKAA